MGINITIRPPLLDDFDQWRLLWAAYNEFYGRIGHTALPEEIILSTWQRFFNATETVNCLLADNNGELVGLAHFISHRNTITIEPTCYLQDLFTDPRMRGKGIARSLISAFYKQVKSEGIQSVYWHTHVSNETSIKLYDRVATNTKFTVYRKTL